ncbi:hypothetical protein [Sulfobacillus sp. hq2]|uniref:hypothetical protein n=1 Tax=Sulfobacillus TaxID=28033 RepID=UPI000CD1BF72|nr:hypothetical protein [Sulfobacillus sp. hq2]POB09239.1 hypothetical protein CO251_16925 [Sulfobacillus sp. hq2]
MSWVRMGTVLSAVGALGMAAGLMVQPLVHAQDTRAFIPQTGHFVYQRFSRDLHAERISDYDTSPLFFAEGNAHLRSIPGHFGPLVRTQVAYAGNQVMVRYGHGLNQIIVVMSPSHQPLRPAWQFTEHISGYPGFTGMTDGLWSTLAFHAGNQNITVIGDRALGLLAQWAKQAFDSSS